MRRATRFFCRAPIAMQLRRCAEGPVGSVGQPSPDLQKWHDDFEIQSRERLEKARAEPTPSSELYNALWQLGIRLWQKKEFEDARKLFEEAVALAAELRDGRERLPAAFCILATLMLDMDDTEAALDYFQKFIPLSEEASKNDPDPELTALEGGHQLRARRQAYLVSGWLLLFKNEVDAARTMMDKLFATAGPLESLPMEYVPALTTLSCSVAVHFKKRGAKDVSDVYFAQALQLLKRFEGLPLGEGSAEDKVEKSENIAVLTTAIWLEKTYSNETGGLMSEHFWRSGMTLPEVLEKARAKETIQRAFPPLDLSE